MKLKSRGKCRLCGEKFADNDAIIEVWHGRKKFDVHRPCLGETVEQWVLGAEAADIEAPETKRERIERRLAFALKVAGRDAKTLAGMKVNQKEEKDDS